MEADFKKHIFLGFFSIVFGFFLWLYVLSSAQTKGVRVLNIRFENPKGFAISNKVIKNIRFKIKGPRVFIRSLSRDNSVFIVDMKKYWEKGKLDYSFDVNDLGIEFPFGVEVEETEPNRINIQYESSMIKQIPIEVKTIGKVAIDHKMILSEISPKTINIAGPRSLVKSVFKIDSMPIDLNNLKGNKKQNIKLKPLDDRIELSENSFIYHYVVKPTRSNMVLKDVPIRFLSSHIVKGSNRRKVNLMVLAENEEKLNFTQEDLEVIALVPLAAKEKMTIPLKVNLPEGMHILEIIPNEVEVLLDIKEK